MSKVQVTYDEHRNWGRFGFQQDFRPYEEVVLYGPMNHTRLWCLVDSGADDLQIHRSFASKLGINLQTQGQVEPVQTASGSVIKVTRVKNVDVEIEGRGIKVDCLFGLNKTPILGRTAILTALDFGFDVNGWLLKP